MKSFQEYVDGAQEEQQNVAAEKNSSPQGSSIEDLTKQIANAYHGRSNADMLKNILMQAEASKRAGTLSNAEIESFYQSFAPMLNGLQKKKLREIVERLKKIE